MKTLIFLISVAIFGMSNQALALEEIKFPTISQGERPPTGSTGQKRDAMKDNILTYVKVYNSDFKKINNVDFDIIGNEQLEYIRVATFNSPDSFYDQPWSEVLKQLSKNLNGLAKARYESMELQVAVDATKRIAALEEKVKEFERVKGTIGNAASISDRLVRNESDISRNASIMWASIILIAIYLVLFKRKK